MRHRKSGLKLGKTVSHRQSMFKNMVTSLFKHDRIRTTDVKAKELRRWADHVITLAKRGDLHARRQAMTIIRDKKLVHQLFENASEKYSKRNGGYTRIVKIGRRAGDAAPVSIIELIDNEKSEKGSTKPKKKAASATPSVKPTVVEDKKESSEETVEATASVKEETSQAEPAEEKASAELSSEDDDKQEDQKDADGGVKEDKA